MPAARIIPRNSPTTLADFSATGGQDTPMGDERVRGFLDEAARVLTKKRYWREIGARGLEELTLVQAADKGYFTFLTGVCRSLDRPGAGHLASALRHLCEHELDYIERVYDTDSWKNRWLEPTVTAEDVGEAYAMGSWRAAAEVTDALDTERPDEPSGTKDEPGDSPDTPSELSYSYRSSD